MKPAAGVMVASPAMAPTQSPTKPGRPTRAQSMRSHRNSATDAEISEFTAAPTATEPVARADPHFSRLALGSHAFRSDRPQGTLSVGGPLCFQMYLGFRMYSSGLALLQDAGGVKLEGRVNHPKHDRSSAFRNCNQTKASS